MSRSLKNIIYTSIVTEITKLHDGKNLCTVTIHFLSMICPIFSGLSSVVTSHSQTFPKELITIDRLQFPVKLDGVSLLLLF